MRTIASLLMLVLLHWLIMPLNAAADGMDTAAKYAYMVDADTGTVLLDKDSKQAMNPSSMSKLMTLYALFEELKSGRITLETTFPVSEKAWKMGGSKMFVHMDTPVTIEELIRGIIVQSGNDACIVAAEGMSGSEEAFAKRLNKTAKRLGLEQSNFMNATGWPHPEHVMSARDIVKLATALTNDFPEYYHYFAEREFTYNNITQQNRNRLLGGVLGVDGLKTGHTEVAGYGISLSAKDETTGRRVVLVINGLKNDAARVTEGVKLLSFGLNAFENKQIVDKDHVIGNLPVWFGSEDTVNFAANEAVIATVLKGDDDSATTKVKAVLPLKAPIAKGDQVATLILESSEGSTKEVPLIATQDIAQATGFRWFSSFVLQYLSSRGE